MSLDPSFGFGREAFHSGSNLMNSATHPQPVETSSVPSAILPSETAYRRANASVESLPSELGPRRIGYGLPCVKCKTYYAADLSMCPVCKSEERVSPVADIAGGPVPNVPEAALPAPDDAALEEERERFLREFKSQAASPLVLDPAELESENNLGCSVEGNHQGGFEPATVCQGCYTRLQERVDLLEAALHLDLIEATRVVYEAVWADPSDPSKTYQNAAQAILGELRKRAGISAVLGPHQPLTH
jgi:hypothetical protein